MNADLKLSGRTFCWFGPLRKAVVAAMAVTLVAGFAPIAMAGEPEQQLPARVAVMADHALVLRLPIRTSTVVVGNPMIADVSIQRNGTAVFTGKSYGVTNVIVQDAAGVILGETIVRVAGNKEAVVVLHRGLERESYVCSERCEASPSLGDGNGFFTGLSGQVSTRSGLAR
jgi:hypothetical protein